MTKNGIDPKPKPPRGYKTICLPFENEARYEQCLRDDSEYRKHLEHWAGIHPELFPPEIGEGFIFYGSYRSRKRRIDLRRIEMKKSREVYQIRPSFLMPYLTAQTDEVEKALYLRLWNVSFDGLAYVFGRDAMYWYRMTLQLGRPALVGTTVKNPEKLPRHLVADEKHTRLQGEKIYAPTTVADGCFFGVAAASGAGTDDLERAYGEFAAEARELNPDYDPETVGTDGWSATDAAWRKLFPAITVILCFLHAVLKLRDRCRRADQEWVDLVMDKAWDVYSATTRSEFLKRFRRLRAWAKKRAPEELREALLAICGKAKLFAKAYDFAGSYRTSNTVDRLMDYQDRVLYAMKYFHGTVESARAMLRSQAMLWNFHPYGARLRRRDSNRSSPAAELNGDQYHENWLHNFLISASLGGRRNLFVKRKEQ